MWRPNFAKNCSQEFTITNESNFEISNGILGILFQNDCWLIIKTVSDNLLITKKSFVKLSKGERASDAFPCAQIVASLICSTTNQTFQLSDPNERWLNIQKCLHWKFHIPRENGPFALYNDANWHKVRDSWQHCQQSSVTLYI